MKDVKGITMTKDWSNVSVIFTGKCYVVQYAYRRDYKPSHFYKDKLKKVRGSAWNTRVENQWTIPKESFHQLKDLFGNDIKWKSTEEIQRQLEELRHVEETLPDVLERANKQIDFSFMKIQPYNFQQLAVAWAATQKGTRSGVYGGLLADEMGLGKTIEALAIAGHFKREFGIKRVLIICLSTLKFQIRQEIQRFTDESCQVIAGGSATKKKKAFEKRIEQYEHVRNNDIFYTIVNYELVRQKESKNGAYIDLQEILKNKYDMVIIDEAHRMQNHQSDTYKAISQINAPYKLLMTGTAMKKRISDIFSLIDYIHPNILSDGSLPFEERLKSFQDKFLMMQFNPFALPKRLWDNQGEKNTELLRNWLAPIMLGRESKDVSDELPKQTVSIIPVEWHPLQKKLYQALKNDMKRLAGELLNEKLSDAQRTQIENEQSALLTYLLEVSDTPELLMRSPSNLALKKLQLVEEFHPFVTDAVPLIKTYREQSNLAKAMREQAIASNKEKQTYEEKIVSIVQKMKETAIDLNKEKQICEEKIASIDKDILRLRKTIETANKKMQKILDQYEVLIGNHAFMVPKLSSTLELVETIVQDYEEKVVIFSKYEKMTQILQREIDKLLNVSKNGRRVRKEKLKNIVMYTGNVKQGCKWSVELEKKKQEAKNLSCFTCPFNAECNTRTKSAYYFQNDPNTKVIIASEAGNTGVNLQEGKYSINYDLPDVRADYDQRNKRTARLGSPHKNVHVYNIVLQGGIDETKAKKLETQKESIDKVMKNDEEQEKAIQRATLQMNQELLLFVLED